MKKLYISFFVASILLMQGCVEESTEENDDTEITDSDDTVGEDPNDDVTDLPEEEDDSSEGGDDEDSSEGEEDDNSGEEDDSEDGNDGDDSDDGDSSGEGDEDASDDSEDDGSEDDTSDDDGSEDGQEDDGGSSEEDDKPKPVLPQGQVNKILKAHNDARAEVGVAPLKWSEKVARSARKWAKKMAKDHPGELEHSPSSFRNDYGENLSHGYSFGNSSDVVMTPQAAVKLWNDEKADYDYESNSCAPNAVCGHYTQVVWANSKKVGCATVKYTHNGRRYQAWVCQYDPAGNYIGQKPY